MCHTNVYNDDEIILQEEMYVKYVTGLQNMLQRYYNVLTSLNPAEVSTCPVKMPDPIHIRSGSTEKHWPEASPIILAHRLASGPDPFGQSQN